MTDRDKRETQQTATDVRPLDVARWVETHGDALFGFALTRLHIRAEAEDAVQETFLAALRAQTQYRGDSGERAWLFGILRHKIVDRIRLRTREVSFEPENESDKIFEQIFDEAGRWRSIPQRWAQPDVVAENEAFWSTLGDCLSILPPTLETTFRLMELDGFETAEACKVLAIQPTNLWVRLHRARLRLRECLERNWFGTLERHRRDKP